MPDGTTAETQDTDGQDQTDTETTDTEATDTEATDTEQPDPGTPSDQVEAEIAQAETLEWLDGLFPFGDLPQHESGGGGGGGQFMFANIEELDGVISQWESQRDDIQADQDKIISAYELIRDPAADEMSVGQADASRRSLISMWQHNTQMLLYAQNYIEKLQLARGDMQTMEDDAETLMRRTYPA